MMRSLQRTSRRLRSVMVLIVAAVTPVTIAMGASTPQPGEAAFRDLYRELVETNTTLSVGSCTAAAEKMAARLQRAGMPAASMQILAPAEFPKSGSLIASYPGRDAKLEPIMLLAHIDVVEARREDWARDIVRLRREVREMRDKMRTHLLGPETSGGKSPRFHIKQSVGGIVDIEFMVQYSVLAWSREYPALSVYTDNIRILEALSESGLIPAGDAQLLTEAYKAYRTAVHHLTLQQRDEIVAADEFQALRDEVCRIWEDLLGADDDGAPVMTDTDEGSGS